MAAGFPDQAMRAAHDSVEAARAGCWCRSSSAAVYFGRNVPARRYERIWAYRYRSRPTGTRRPLIFFVSRARARARPKKSQHDPNKCLNLNRNGCNISIKLCIDQAKSYDQDLYRGDVNPGFGDGTIVEHDPTADPSNLMCFGSVIPRLGWPSPRHCGASSPARPSSRPP
jgi:hypothetical protein